MEQLLFVTESKQELAHKHHLVLRNLYLPIIGMEATTLYSILNDYHYMNKSNPTYIDLKDLARTMRVDINVVFIAKKKLEAVGLLRTYEKADNKHFVFVLNAPLTPELFRKNIILYQNAIKQIGEVIFERIFFNTKEQEIKKDEFKEVTVKYHDVFDVVKEVKTTTLEMPIAKFKNRDEAVKGLTPAQYVNFATGTKVSPNQLQLLNRLQNSGLSSHSINEIVDYSIEINGKMVSNHVGTIANDMISRSITNPVDIKIEMTNAKNKDKPVTSNIQVVKSVNTKIDDDLSWNDIFDSLGGEL